MHSLAPLPAVFATVAGLLLGSFLNVCIARLPRHASVVWPGSHCPRCSAPIRPFDNIPLLSFLLLRGRCRTCREAISPRYPLVEACLPALFLLCVARFPSPLNAAEAGTLCFLLLGLLVMDAETFLLPNAFTYPGILLGIAASTLPGGGLTAGLQLGATAPSSYPAWAAGVSGLFLGGGVLLAIRIGYRILRGREGMGLGDVKLGVLLGAWLGVAGVLLTLTIAVLLGAALGILLLARDRKNAWIAAVPFGIFLSAAGLLTLFAGRPVLAWYLHFYL